MTIKIFVLTILTALSFASCEEATYCSAQKDLLQIDKNAPVIPLNFEYSTEAMETMIAEEFDHLDSICGRSPVFLVPFDFNKNKIEPTQNATLVSFSAISHCAEPMYFPTKSRYDLSILINQHNELLMQGEIVSRFELTKQLKKWYFGIPEEQEETMKKTRFRFIYNGTEEIAAQDSLIRTLHSLTESYLDIAEQVAQGTYKRSICKLSAIEIKNMKEQLPFHVLIRLKSIPPPPPPPLEIK